MEHCIDAHYNRDMPFWQVRKGSLGGGGEAGRMVVDERRWGAGFGSSGEQGWATGQVWRVPPGAEKSGLTVAVKCGTMNSKRGGGSWSQGQSSSLQRL